MNNKTDSRDKILITAAKLFQIKGYNGVGLNEIIKESNSPKGSLYYYFPNGKEELALEAIKFSSEIIKNRLRIVFDKYSNPIDAIMTVINDISESLKKDNKLQDISISLLALETYLSSEPLRKACEEAFIGLQNIYIQKLINSRFPEDAAKSLGVFIQIAIEGAISVAVTQQNPIALLNVGEQISKLLEPYIHNS